MFEKAIIEFMKLIDLKPLQYLAAVRVAISVCESEDVQDMIGKFQNDGSVGFSDIQWRHLCAKVIRKLNQKGVHKLITDNVLEKLWPISFEISKWILYHVNDTGIDCSSSFCWTPQVNIDYTKTAEILVKNEALDINKRFKLACCYCMEPEIRSLWEQMSLLNKRSFFIRGNLMKSHLNPIIIYWTYFIQEVPIDFWDNKALNPSLSFKYAVRNGYLSASKYFFHKLKSQIQTRMISNCFADHLPTMYKQQCMVKDHLAIACFLSSQLRSNCWGYIRYHELVFRYFLEWPMQKYFSTLFNRMMSYMSSHYTFERIMQAIIEKDIMGFQDHDYKELFKDVWLQGPVQYKTLVTDSARGFLIFMKFVKKHFGFVFEENSFALKTRFRAILFQQEIPKDAAERGNVEFFKFLIREGVTTKAAVSRYATSPRWDFPIGENAGEYCNFPLGELKYLMDIILAIV